MAKELAAHQILVNAVTSGSTITQERIDGFTSGKFGANEAPADAPKTRAMTEAMLKSGGFEQTFKMLPQGRPGFPDEIAKAVLFLASDMGSYVNGNNLGVDGAQTLR